MGNQKKYEFGYYTGTGSHLICKRKAGMEGNLKCIEKVYDTHSSPTETWEHDLGSFDDVKIEDDCIVKEQMLEKHRVKSDVDVFIYKPKMDLENCEKKNDRWNFECIVKGKTLVCSSHPKKR